MGLAESNLIYIVDDDQSVRLSLAMLLRAHGFDTHSFGAGVDFFDSFTALQPAPILSESHLSVGSREVQKH